jgi:ssDNA-binding Zn-finger/Zn-ribbon topoisomerase 1
MDYQKCLCPDCKTGSIKEQRGKFGKFYTCSNNCGFKVSQTKIIKLINDNIVRELTQEELIKLLVG